MTQRVEDLLNENVATEEHESTVSQKGKTKLTLGVSNNGVNFAARKSSNRRSYIVETKELISKLSETTIGWNRKETGTVRYYFTHKVPLSIQNHPYFGQIYSSTSYEVDTKRTKYDSREEVFSWELKSELTPWTLTL